ncbi:MULTISPECIES: DUF6894 family protein [Methylobacterium]|uniref:DUF6894 family protein n=1 Tax=Methylobacterium TaxID=407 RepID=UPI00104B1D45|nr:MULTISPECIES: hypothetical protein [Methylobacterium]MDR7038872.1 hypothetical protein [Methylobacterium sp. BE186]
MPRYYFHLRTRDALQWDPEGVCFPGLDEAYLDVCQAVREIAVEYLQTGRPRTEVRCYAFEITDAEGRLLMDVPFTEVLDGLSSRPRRMPASAIKAQTEIERTRRLIASVGEQREALQATLGETQLLMTRLRALSEGQRGLNRTRP